MKAGLKTVLVVDDDEHNRRHLRTLLSSEGYQVMEAIEGAMALQIVGQLKPDLILLDAMMPLLDGFDLTHKLKSEPDTQNIPIIMLTSLDDRASKLRALQCGVEEFVSKPIDRAELWARVRNLLKLKEYNDLLANYSQTLEIQVKQRTDELLASHFDFMFSIMRAAEFRDQETGAHIHRIAYYCQEIAIEMGMDEGFVNTIYHASPLHDVGKIGIPDRILLKPGYHTPEEWNIMKTHAVLGENILGGNKSSSPFIRMGAEIALNHHEHWDGSGYPNGLQGKDIPISARIMTIADVYDALRSQRPYKSAYPHEQAMRIITRGDNRTEPQHFDPQVMDAFTRAARRFEDAYAEHVES